MNKQGIVKRSRATETIKRLAILLNAAPLAVALASPGASIALAAQIKRPASRVAGHAVNLQPFRMHQSAAPRD